jgi:hypothetical protein
MLSRNAGKVETIHSEDEPISEGKEKKWSSAGSDTFLVNQRKLKSELE